MKIKDLLLVSDYLDVEQDIVFQDGTKLVQIDLSEDGNSIIFKNQIDNDSKRIVWQDKQKVSSSDETIH